MPIKRRISKHRPQVGPEAWEMVFLSGHDFFGALDALGLPDPLSALPDSEERKAAKAAWQAATEAAWKQHGAAFLTAHDAAQGPCLTPWAMETFGPPEGYANAR